VLKKVKSIIEEYNMIIPGETVTVGVSGGADSVCLLLNLIEYSKKVPILINVVHINHLIREEAGEDASFVRDLCEKYDLPFYLFEEKVEEIAKDKGISTEEAGRNIRYMRFSEISKGGKIAVAHNSNDVAETVLFNIFRGTGIEGLASLEPVNGNIIRPLLNVTREEIEEYLDKKKQSFVIDKTNKTELYARNKIRNTILPYAEEKIVEGATEHISALSNKMRLIRHYIEKQTQACFEKAVTLRDDEMIINIEEFCQLEELMQQEVILLSLEKLTSGRKDIGEKHIAAILSIVAGEGEKRVDLPYGLEAVKHYDSLIIRKRKNKDDKEEKLGVKINGEGVFSLGKYGQIKSRIFSYDRNMSIERNTYTKWFDYDKIINCLEVRNRVSKDYLTVNSQMSKKALKDYFIDEKIPREKRDSIPVVADGSQIVWVIGYRISEAYKVTDNTKTIIELVYID